MTQAVAAANGSKTAHKTTKPSATAATLEERLELKLKAARKHRGTIRFFTTHRSLLATGEQQAKARGALRRARRGLARAIEEIRYYRGLIRRRAEARESRRLAKAPPRTAICGVFGRRYCRQAVSVAWCESRLQTTAENGQYLGLFQMGSSERRIFGHGDTAHAQALAAHRYFVRSGRDWSPWSCRWAAS
jgi:hypothetical protein